MTKPVPRIGGLSEIAPRYDAILCDVWGVLHNGIAAWPGAIEALSAFRANGGHVVMITNAPRPHGPVLEQLEKLGVPDGVFDRVVTSGDVTRELIMEKSRRAFHIGPDRDLTLYEGLDVELVDKNDADSVVCTGLVDDRTESPQDYAPLLGELAARNLPFICANPDIVVEMGDRLLWCAGALARDYEALGGQAFIVGKPHPHIYRSARHILDELAGRKIDTARILAIGDGMPTDVKGAMNAGLDLLYISAGIHAGEYGDVEKPDEVALSDFLANHRAAPVAWMPRLKW
ncbi:MAG TPA: TIGR01459 family HAD-type hydrolase [Rhizobiaceae bacterium]|nr:TIGR01459 family HAD-type hydrolase [Rhizobiaceae bacterium]